MAESGRRLNYLTDIDGLRAVAVLAVVLYHLQVPGFAGGYVGVDIFFVISGFLISGLIRDRAVAGNFSLGGFYASRVLRLLPSVLVTVAGTAAVAILILQPGMMSGFALSASAAVFSAANFVFYFESGYWDAAGELKPLLHLWSLGVEEQFYLFWPTVLILLYKLPATAYRAGLLLILAASLAACIAMTNVDSAAAFYLLPFRIWQFALGALAVELWRGLVISEFSRQLLRSVGLALCGISIATFSDATPFPGWQAIIPSAGAALVLLASHETSGSVWLSNTSARWLGRISYAMYLAHWPPIALYRAYTLQELTGMVQLLLAVVTLALTVALHYGVERRCYRRDAQRVTGWHRGASITLATAVTMALLLLLPAQMPDQFTRRDVLLSAADIEGYQQRRFAWIRQACRIDRVGAGKRCPLPPENSAILFIGNSHEPDAFNILVGALGMANLRGSISFGSIDGCRELVSNRDWASSTTPDCQRRLDALRALLDDIRFKAIVYSARRPYRNNKEALVNILDTIKSRQAGVPLVTFEDYFSTRTDCASLINHYGSDRACGRLENLEHFPGLIPDATPLKERVSALSDYRFSKLELLCGDNRPGSCPTSTPDGDPVFVDGHHLTREFAVWIGRLLAQQNPTWLQAVAATPPDPQDLRVYPGQ